MAVYGFDAAWERERDRLRMAEAVFDPSTTHHLTSIGVGPGWRCLEVGAGAGSIAVWLAEAVAPTGRVLATDIDPRFLADLKEPGLEVLRHDITADQLPDEAFDLAHARLVLQHLRDRERAVERMVAAVAPGGWVLLEELDFVTSSASYPESGRDFERVERAVHRLLADTGFEPDFGRHLPALLQDAGLVDVENEGSLSVVAGGSPGALWQRMTFETLTPRLLERGLVSKRELKGAMVLLENPAFSLMMPVLMAARGRKPPSN
jgi:SAM-dependent methyltransferase